MSESAAVVQLTGVTKSYQTVVALGPLDLSVSVGQTTVLIGPSGCGKSTLLRLVNGLIKPDAGSVEVFGKSLIDGDARPARLRMGYVIQEGGLFPHLTARDNVILMARQLAWDAHQISERLDVLVDMSQLPSSLLQRYPVELSGGQRQRVSLLRALMLEPELLLLDEPLGALDPMIRLDLQQDLKRIFTETGCAVLMVTHDLHEAGYFADELVLLNHGRIEQRGKLDELLDNPASSFVSRFTQAQHMARH